MSEYKDPGGEALQLLNEARQVLGLRPLKQLTIVDRPSTGMWPEGYSPQQDCAIATYLDARSNGLYCGVNSLRTEGVNRLSGEQKQKLVEILGDPNHPCVQPYEQGQIRFIMKPPLVDLVGQWLVQPIPELVPA